MTTNQELIEIAREELNDPSVHVRCELVSDDFGNFEMAWGLYAPKDGGYESPIFKGDSGEGKVYVYIYTTLAAEWVADGSIGPNVEF